MGSLNDRERGFDACSRVTALHVQQGEPTPGFPKATIKLKGGPVHSLRDRQVERRQGARGQPGQAYRLRRRLCRVLPDPARLCRTAKVQQRRCHAVTRGPRSRHTLFLGRREDADGCLGAAPRKQIRDRESRPSRPSHVGNGPRARSAAIGALRPPI